MAEWEEPIIWTTGKRLRARDLNHDLNSNIAWLADRPMDLKTIYQQAANINVSGTDWTTLGPQYQLEVFVPDVSNVLLVTSFNIINAGSNHRIWFDWLRDGEYWVGAAQSTKPASSGAGIGEVNGNTSTEDHLNTLFWDVNVPAGRHTYDLMFTQAANSLDIRVADMTGQLLALVW